MTRKYEEVWRRLIAKEEVILQCPKRGVKAVCQAIYKEKGRHQNIRKQKRQPGFGRIIIEKQDVPSAPLIVRLIVKLTFIGDML